ncbi:MAG: NADPH-dependent F420 reductase [Bryobacteraceae bacterium]
MMDHNSRTIAVIGGTGPEGLGLARRWARAGEDIVIGSRDAQRAHDAASQLAAELGSSARIRGMENVEAVAAADVVVLTVPFSAQAATLKRLKPAFRAGAILIDATVPLAASVGGHATRTLGVWQGSAAQQAAELVPKEVPVVAAFHHVSSESLKGDQPVECDAILCSNDEPARAVAASLAEKIPGVRAVNGGKLENARVLEEMTALLIAINQKYKVHAVGIRLTGLPPGLAQK